MKSSPNRIDILEVLNFTKPQTYSELKSLAGFKSKKQSGEFLCHLIKLLQKQYLGGKRQSLIALNKSNRRYRITSLGRLVLSVGRKIEERGNQNLLSNTD